MRKRRASNELQRRRNVDDINTIITMEQIGSGSVPRTVK